MVCSCERDYWDADGRPRLRQRDLETHLEVSIDLGFVEKACPPCRGLPEQAFPRAEGYRAPSKFLRYYWREIELLATQKLIAWARASGHSTTGCRTTFSKELASFRDTAVKELRALHQVKPKYHFSSTQNDAVLKAAGVKGVRLEARYVSSPDRRARVLDGDEPYTVDEYTCRYFQRLGWQTLILESRPFHVLFATFMFLVVQDHGDELVRLAGFGSRTAFDKREKKEIIWTFLPEDFGSQGWAIRRAQALEEHWKLMPRPGEDVDWLFDYWVEASANLREYLWAHRPEDVERARQVLKILGPQRLQQILQYLAEDYWGRYLGWPDLLVYKEDEFFLAEVKSSKDALSENQERWIRDNANQLRLPFKLVKVHRINEQKNQRNK